MTRWVFLVLVAISAWGCKMSERLNGTYEGLRDVQVRPGTDPVIENQLQLVRITGRDNGSASLSDQGMALEGELDYGSKSVQFVPKQIAGRSADVEPDDVVKRYTITIIPQKDGSWLYDGSVKLTKKR